MSVHTVDPVPDSESGLVLTIEEAAKRLSIGRTMMYQLLKDGEVRSVRIGRLHRIPAECLSEYVSKLLADDDSGRSAA